MVPAADGFLLLIQASAALSSNNHVCILPSGGKQITAQPVTHESHCCAGFRATAVSAHSPTGTHFARECKTDSLIKSLNIAIKKNM